MRTGILARRWWQNGFATGEEIIVDNRAHIMSETASQLLATFASLPSKEQHELLVEMLRRTQELPDTAVSDDQLVGLADKLFQTLDAEETNADDNAG